MSAPQPWAGEAQRLVEGYARATARHAAPAVLDGAWAEALRRDEARRPIARRALAFVCSALIAMLSTTAGLRAQLHPGTQAQFEVASDAVFTRVDSTLHLTRGRVRLRTAGTPAQVVTLQVTVVVTQGRVLVDAGPVRTVLTVEEGSIVFRDGSGERHASAGERVIVPIELALGARQEVPSCEGVSAGQIAGCLRSAALGDGLEAQTAVFELGLTAHEAGQPSEALAHFEAYQQRFPHGVLAPEVSIAVMLETKALGYTARAEAEAAAFLSNYPDDPRAPDVALWRAQAE